MGGDHGHAHASTGNLRTAFLLNLGFTVIEVIGGLWTNSVAILSDAVHDLGDSISLGLAWYFDKLSKKGRTAHNTYGYRRYSLLGGLITGVVLITGLGFVLWNAAVEQVCCVSESWRRPYPVRTLSESRPYPI